MGSSSLTSKELLQQLCSKRAGKKSAESILKK